MSTETISPDIGFSREQKEYLEGYFRGLASRGMIPFVGHLPDGRMTDVPAPGLVNGAAEAATPQEKSFMLRCRIPAGEMTSIQLRGLADLAEAWGGGYADITTRANFQVREIAPRNIKLCRFYAPAQCEGTAGTVFRINENAVAQ
jgi:sulfite reductase beta subunit-like hemoprotein